MGFCTPDEHRRFLRQCPVVEHQWIDDGIILQKYWLSISPGEHATTSSHRERKYRYVPDVAAKLIADS
jgi:polyphosphate kinase 2 (PPK2 family)